MEKQGTRDIFLDSLDRCTSHSGFLSAFYERFIASSDDIRIKFLNTDFDVQEKMLLRSLRISAGATSGDTHALQEIRARAETHDRHHLNIRPELYDFWRDAILETASEFDPSWSDEIEQAWTQTLDYVIRYMIRQY